jgi:hypothetical protein
MRLPALLILLTALAAACLHGGQGGAAPSTGCDGPHGTCARYVQGVDTEGAPVDRATVVIPFTAPVRVNPTAATPTAATPVFDFATRRVTVRSVPATVRADPQRADQVIVAVDGLLADGAEIQFPAGLLHDGQGHPLGALSITLHTPYSPLDVALAGVVWQPTDRSLFQTEGLPPVAAPATAEEDVRQELVERLRVRAGLRDEEIGRVLARYDDPDARQRVPNHRVRAGLLLLTGTSGQDAVDVLLAPTTRDGLAIQPVRVAPLSRTRGLFAYVQSRPLSGTLVIVVDSAVADGPLEGIAVVLAHEAVHVGFGEGSAAEETLAMALNTRVYEELLLWDPSLAYWPSPLIRQQNRLVLALRNSGRFDYPRAGLLPRPGVTDALASLDPEPARSFRDLLLAPHYYGDIPRTGALGSQMLERFYQRLSGTRPARGSVSLDEATLRRFDAVLDHGFTAAQILALVDALKLTPVPKPGDKR